VDSAFRSADWSLAQRSTFGSLAKETEAIVLSRRDSTAPMSHLYYLGRMEDLRFERASPSARARHHVRLWRTDSTGALWAAAATEDVGVLVSARRRSVTHRVAPDVDRERDLLVGDLLAGGCAALEGYATLPGADTTGATVAGQRYVTDARVAVVSVAACGPARDASVVGKPERIK
jgi:LssY-like putative type I secretion system component LssY